MGSMTGRRALVTGGAGGLGSVAVRTLLELGAEDVLVVGRSQAKLDEFKKKHPDRVSVRAMDVADPKAWEAAADWQFDVVIPAAGVSYREAFLDASFEHWQEILQVNTVGTMLAVKAVLPGMLERKWGRIILISSVVANMGLPGRALYAASKAALEAWARTLAVEIGGNGVLINCVAPGMFPTALTISYLKANPDFAESTTKRIPEHRFGDPDEIASAFRYLLETTYAQGTVLHLDGGWGIS
jgi:3-oxoacyl-[acyl-carrier protein] reductase